MLMKKKRHDQLYVPDINGDQLFIQSVDTKG